MTLLAEDGNKLPGGARVQASVALAAGKTYDVTIQPAASGTTYTNATYAVFDRQLSLSTSNQRDGGMQAYITVGSGASSGAGSADSAVGLTASNKPYYCSAGKTLSIIDPTLGLLGGTVGANGVALATGAGGTSRPPRLAYSVRTARLHTFQRRQRPAAARSSLWSMARPRRRTRPASRSATPLPRAACAGTAPTAGNGSYTSNIVSRLQVAPPGVLAFVTNP